MLVSSVAAKESIAHQTDDFMPFGTAIEKKGYINIKGEVVIPPIFQYARRFLPNGLAVDTIDSEKYRYIRANGEFASPYVFDSAGEFNSLGLADVKYNGKWGAINIDGQFAIPAIYEDMGHSDPLGFTQVKKNGKWFFVRKDGSVAVIPKIEVDHVYKFSIVGLAPVRANNKFGFINTNGELVIPFKFDSVGDNGYSGRNRDDDFVSFSGNGLCPVAIGEKWGYINKSGEFVIAPDFDDAYSFSENGIALTKSGGRYSFRRPDGSLQFNKTFEDAHSFRDGVAPVKINGKWGFVNSNGEIAVSPQFDHISQPREDGVWYVRNMEIKGVRDRKAGLIRSDGIFVEPMVNDADIDQSFKIFHKFRKEEGYELFDTFLNAKGEVIAYESTAICENGFGNIPVLMSKDKISWPKNPQEACASLKAEKLKKAENEARKLAQFRSSIKLETETNCGPVLEMKGGLAKVYAPVANYGNEHWIKKDQLFPAGQACRFVNGRYQGLN